MLTVYINMRCGGKAVLEAFLEGLERILMEA